MKIIIIESFNETADLSKSQKKTVNSLTAKEYKVSKFKIKSFKNIQSTTKYAYLPRAVLTLHICIINSYTMHLFRLFELFPKFNNQAKQIWYSLQTKRVRQTDNKNRNNNHRQSMQNTILTSILLFLLQVNAIYEWMNEWMIFSYSILLLLY